MATILFLFLILCNVLLASCKLRAFEDEVNPTRNFVYWPNATVPFYINPEHYDEEQTRVILSALSLFAFRSCVQFRPVMAAPFDQHVLVIENPGGTRKCEVNSEAHSLEEPHRITVGYECMKPPYLDMVIMRALGFPFEHNRASRDIFIDVQFENIEPGSMDLFTKDRKLPPGLRSLPYDVNSVTHFGERDHSKNGKKTIIFKDKSVAQNRIGLSPTDLRKIELVYGPECKKRDRQAKIDLCNQYPVRKKRDLLEHTRSLRVNPDITPPPETLDSIQELGINDQVSNIVEDVYKLSATALNNAREKYCNKNQEALRIGDSETKNKDRKPDILGIISLVTEYTKDIVENAMANLTEFCESSQSVDAYVRARCSWYDGNSGRCPQYFKSTKSGAVKYSTQHRPVYHQSTKHKGRAVVYNYDHFGRAGLEGNATDKANKTKITDNGDNEENVASDEKSSSNSTDKSLNRKKRSVAINEDITTTEMTLNTDSIDEKNSTKDMSRMVTTTHVHKRGNFSANFRRNSDHNREREKPIEPQEHRIHVRKRPRPKDEKTEKDGVIQIVEKNRDRLRIRWPKKRIKERLRISQMPKTVLLSKENKEFYNERKWPERIVKYVIKNDERYDLQDLRSRLHEVNAVLKNFTCVRIEEISEEESDNTMDFLYLDTSPDYVTGRVGGKQIFGSVELFEGGQHRQHAAMMVMAMLGFYFEVSRHDRDQYIRVHNRHVRPDKLHHFEKIRSDATLPLPYDYNSATHPAWQFWRKLGKRGISSVATYKDQDPDGSIMKSLGQNEQLLSKYDVVKINSVYGVQCFRNQRRMKIQKPVG